MTEEQRKRLKFLKAKYLSRILFEKAEMLSRRTPFNFVDIYESAKRLQSIVNFGL